MIKITVDYILITDAQRIDMKSIHHEFGNYFHKCGGVFEIQSGKREGTYNKKPVAQFDRFSNLGIRWLEIYFYAGSGHGGQFFRYVRGLFDGACPCHRRHESKIDLRSHPG